MQKKETKNKGKVKKKRNCKCKWIKKRRGKEKEDRTGKLIGRQIEKFKERKEKKRKVQESQFSIRPGKQYAVQRRGGEDKRHLFISSVDIFDQNIG